MHRLVELVRLHRMGVRPRQVARELRMGPNTERRYRDALSDAGLLAGAVDDLPSASALRAAVMERLPPKSSPQQRSKVEKWRARVEKLLTDGLEATAIHDRLRLEDEDYVGSIGGMKRLVRRIRGQRGVEPSDVAIPVETEPGEIAQVDFGYAGKHWDEATGRLRKSWVFVMTLAHSRHAYARVVFDQSTATWLWLHQEAFRWFGGVPRVLVPDNLKAAVIRAAFGVDGEPSLNRSYRELARHYGFRVDPTPPRAPKKKGKVEANVKYVKRNALAGREGEPIDEVNEALARWMTDIAGQRVHGTTRRKPLEVFRTEERAALLPLPAKPYDRAIWLQATVHRDSHVCVERRLYSVPWRLIGQRVWVRVTSHSVVVFADEERVATHSRSGAGHRSTRDEHLPEGRAELRHRSRSYWEDKASRIGDDVLSYVREVFDADDVLLNLRTVQSIVGLLEEYPAERANAACRRASYYGVLKYAGVKNILLEGLDLEPLPVGPVSTWSDMPHYARRREGFTLRQEASDEHH